MKEKKYYGWKSFCFKKNNIELSVVPEIGGRIISLKYDDEELLFVDKNHLGEVFIFDSKKDFRGQKKSLGFRIWGGDKTWVAPEDQWIDGIPPIDLDASPYHYELLDDGIIMESGVDRETHLRIVREIHLLSNNKITLNQILVNKGNASVKKAIWNVTQLLRPFNISVLINKDKVISDNRFKQSLKRKDYFVFQEKDWTTIRCDQSVQFKYGMKPTKGVVVASLAINENTLVMVRAFEVDCKKKYPHMDDSVEVYNSSDHNYLELEILSPLVTLAPQESISHKQTWIIKKIDGHKTTEEIAEKLT